MSTWFFVLIQATVVAYALVGGVFLAFSDFIMRAFSKTGGDGGIDAMQVLNKEVFRWVFMTLFLGLAPVSLGIAVYSVINLTGAASVLIGLAGAVYLVGCFGVTIAFNVPMNEALAKMDLGTAATRAYWTGTYLPRWTRWNTVRTVACVISSVLVLSGLTWAVQPT